MMDLASIADWYQIPCSSDHSKYDVNWLQSHEKLIPHEDSVWQIDRAERDHVRPVEVRTFYAISKNQIKTQVGDSSKTISPLMVFGGGDLALLFSGTFVLVMPENQQQKLFSGKPYKMYFGKDDKGNYNVAQHLQFAPDVAKQYLLAHTEVQEAMGSEKNVIKFSVRLNMQDFCKYGRPFSDFVSK